MLVEKLEDNWHARDHIQDNTVRPVIIRLDDTDDKDSDDSDSDAVEQSSKEGCTYVKQAPTVFDDANQTITEK